VLPEIEIFETSDRLTSAAAERFVTLADAAIRARGKFVVALSGGTTPQAMYGRLAAADCQSRVRWEHVHFFWGDERCVPSADPANNARMASAALLDLVPVRGQQIHRVRTEDSPTQAAASYEAELRASFGTPLGAPSLAADSRFDLVLLGLGADGHTASLFPGLAAVGEAARWVVAEYVPSVSMWRVTLTPVVINAAAEIVFLVAGSEKASILQRVLEGPHDPRHLPAQVIMPTAGRLRWLVDAAAASGLQHRTVVT